MVLTIFGYWCGASLLVAAGFHACKRHVARKSASRGRSTR